MQFDLFTIASRKMKMYADPFYRPERQAISKGRNTVIGFRDDVAIVPYRQTCKCICARAVYTSFAVFAPIDQIPL